MSGLLKAAAVDTTIRSLPERSAALPSANSLVVDPVRSLEDRIAKLEAELARASAELPAQLGKAREEGRLAGLKERDESAAERRMLLERAASQAISAWVEQLASSHGLAIEISRTVLKRMIGNPDWHGELIQAAITKRLAELDARSLLSVRVSGDDFAEDELSSITSDPTARIIVDPELESGECVVDLTMGHVELGRDAQWRRVAALLDELAGGPC